MTEPLTVEQAVCMADIRQNDGVIRRHRGGYWFPGELSHATSSEWYADATVRALVRKGELAWSMLRPNGTAPAHVEARIPEITVATEPQA